MEPETPVAGVIGVGRRFSLIVPIEKLVGFAGGIIAVGFIGLLLVIWPVWALYGVLLRNAPWAMLGLLAFSAVWWTVWRPVQAYRKARR